MSSARPDISIVTPTFNMLPSLKRSAASVQDQGVAFEHIIMDGGSKDGTAEWLATQPGVKGFSESDRGMYHALNKAIRKTNAEIIGHLNGDEQYLPGTLGRVIDFFAHHPDVDFVAGDFLVVNPEGKFIAYRKTFQPRWPYFFSNYLYTTTCTLFYRRKIFDQVMFNESYRSIADVIFLYQVMKAGFRGAHLPGYTATFTYSGVNLSLDPVSAREKKRFLATLPLSFRVMKPLFFLSFFMEKVLHGNYREAGSLRYAIYASDNLGARKEFVVDNPGFRLRFVATSTSG
jgi:glycosyltransferase involved in cell wall biosynthesis